MNGLIEKCSQGICLDGWYILTIDVWTSLLGSDAEFIYVDYDFELKEGSLIGFNL
jgi:hypothetical protein